MSSLAELMKCLADAGASGEVMAAAASWYEQQDSERKTKVRERVRRHRENTKNSEMNVTECNVTKRDVTLPSVTVTPCNVTPASPLVPPLSPTPPNPPYNPPITPQRASAPVVDLEGQVFDAVLFEDSWTKYRHCSHRAQASKKEAKEQWRRQSKKHDMAEVAKVLQHEITRRNGYTDDTKPFLARLPALERWLRKEMWFDSPAWHEPGELPLEQPVETPTPEYGTFQNWLLTMHLKGEWPNPYEPGPNDPNHRIPADLIDWFNELEARKVG